MSTDLHVCKGIMSSSRLQSSADLIWNTVDADLTRKQDGHGSHCSYICAAACCSILEVCFVNSVDHTA